MPFHGCIRRLELKQAENIIVNVDLGYEQVTRAKKRFQYCWCLQKVTKNRISLSRGKISCVT